MVEVRAASVHHMHRYRHTHGHTHGHTAPRHTQPIVSKHAHTTAQIVVKKTRRARQFEDARGLPTGKLNLKTCMVW